ncbi:hypothetical protein RhiJN_07135 [Ceratobasidium sp. AG-Ba]|nr:hypothetical protein RhiJN_07135 [Ceratobasidium sp. AG-Ba]QRW08010.1 hypothetical protein RhiLY_07009 [Ceratobasidium sp. AG-Ba]
MGMNNEPGPRSTSMNMRPSPLGRSLTIAPDVPLQNGNHRSHETLGDSHRPVNHDGHRPLGLNLDGHRNIAIEAKSLHSPTFPPGQVDPTYPPPPPNPSLNDRGPFAAREQQHASPEPYQSPQGSMTPAQRALVGGGFGSDSGYVGNGGYVDEMRTPPEGGMHSGSMENIHSGMDMHPNGHQGGMGSSGQASPMLFAGVGVEGDPSYDLNAMNSDSLAMAMIGQEYAMPVANEFVFA